MKKIMMECKKQIEREVIKMKVKLVMDCGYVGNKKTRN